jgi:hypothetical protein
VIQQGRFPKTIREVLHDHGLVCHGRHRRVDLGPGRIRQKEGGAGPDGEMPDVKDWPSFFAESVEQRGRVDACRVKERW